MRFGSLALIISLLCAGSAMAGPEEQAISIFKKVCLAAPMQPDANIKGFLGQPGLHPRDNYLERSVKADGTFRNGVYAFPANDKSVLAQVQKTPFAQQATCLVEVKGNGDFQAFVNKAYAMIAKQPGFQGPTKPRGKKFVAFAMNGYRVELIPVIGGKKFDLVAVKL